MAIALTLVAVSPVNNPERFFFAAAFSGTYGAAGGAGDVLNFTPFQSSANVTGFQDPNELLGTELTTLPAVPPGSFSEQLGGGAVQAYLGANLAACVARCYGSNGNELTQGNPYPANFLNGSATLEVLLPVRQGE